MMLILTKAANSNHFFLTASFIFSVILLHVLYTHNPIQTASSIRFPTSNNSAWFLGESTSADMDDLKCRSKIQYFLYRRLISQYNPSEELRVRLAEYEEMHQSCVNNDGRLKNGSVVQCRFVVYVPPFGGQGLGNKMLGVVSTFLYALLTNRVLMISRDENMDKLFCDPFPGSSWLLPDAMSNFNQFLNDSFRLGNLVGELGQGQCRNASLKFPDQVYVYLSNDFSFQDTKFFCPEQQELIDAQVTWVYIRSNVYFSPAFFYVPSFKAELERLLPQQEASFHHLARYLLHPSDPLWKKITRYYNSYLGQAQHLVGLQMRIPAHLRHLRENYADEFFRCATQNKLLPDVVVVNLTNTSTSSSTWRSSGRKKSPITAALVASLEQQHFDRLRNLYLDHDTDNGTYVAVHQASHEGEQRTGELGHDERALTDMYLLSFCDVLVTTPGSTFGYIAQGLAGIRPWLMWQGPGSGEVCAQVKSLEPCYFTFPGYNCDCKREVVLDNVQGCEDAPIAPGLKLKADNY